MASVEKHVESATDAKDTKKRKSPSADSSCSKKQATSSTPTPAIRKPTRNRKRTLKAIESGLYLKNNDKLKPMFSEQEESEKSNSCMIVFFLFHC